MDAKDEKKGLLGHMVDWVVGDGSRNTYPSYGPCHEGRGRSMRKHSVSAGVTTSANTVSGSHDQYSKECASEEFSTQKEKGKAPQESFERRENIDNVLLEARSQLERCHNDLALQQANADLLKAEICCLRKKNDMLKSERDAADSEYAYFSSRYRHIVNKYLKPYGRHLGISYNDTNGDTMDIFLGPLITAALEARALNTQLHSLQEEMLANVEKVQAVSDEHFAQDFRALASTIKSLSRLIQLSSKVDVFQVLGTHTLAKNVSSHHWMSRGRKKCFVEAYIWSVLLDTIFQTPFNVVGNLFHVDDFWRELFGTGSDPPIATTASEIWRYTTVGRLADIVGRKTITTGKSHRTDSFPRNSLVSAPTESIMQARTDVANAILRGLEQVSPDVDAVQIHSIVDKAFGLALQMSLQRCRIQVTFPKPGASFIGQEMSCVADTESDVLARGVVAFVINPGLTKWGDALGKNLNHRYDIVTSLVQLEPAVEEEMGISLVQSARGD